MALRNVLVATAGLALAGMANAQLPPLSKTAVIAQDPDGRTTLMQPLTAPDQIPGAPTDPPPNLPPIPQSWLASAWDPQPRFEVRFDVAFLQPDFATSRNLARQVQTNQNKYLINDVGVDSHSEYTAGVRTALEWHFNEFKSLEFQGFFVDGPRQRSVPMGQSDFSLGLGAGVFPGGPMVNQPFDFPRISEEGRFDWNFEAFGAEINWLHHFIHPKGPLSDVAIGFGARYMGILENVQVRFLDEILLFSGNMQSDVENHLYGPQVVGRARIQSPFKRIRLVTEGKVGLMANAVQVNNQLTSNAGIFGISDNTDTIFSAIFEGNFMFEFFVTKHLTVFGGYELLYASRTLRAPEQLNPDLTNFVSPQKQIGNTFLHGPRVGLVFAY